MFDKVDKDHDGFVTEHELKDWIHFTQNRYIMKDVEKQMQQTDLNKDGFIDWDEYKKATYGFMDDEQSTYKICNIYVSLDIYMFCKNLILKLNANKFSRILFYF